MVIFEKFRGHKFSRNFANGHFRKNSRSQIFAKFRDFLQIAKLNDRENFWSRKFLTAKICDLKVPGNNQENNLIFDKKTNAYDSTNRIVVLV